MPAKEIVFPFQKSDVVKAAKRGEAVQIIFWGGRYAKELGKEAEELVREVRNPMCQMTESALLQCGKDGTATTERNIAPCSWKPSNLSWNSKVSTAVHLR